MDGLADTDLVAFGADTFISLMDENGTVLVDGIGNNLLNDDRNNDFGECINDALSFSSLLLFSPPVSATYYIELISSPELTLGPGKYGSYSLIISEIP